MFDSFFHRVSFSCHFSSVSPCEFIYELTKMGTLQKKWFTAGIYDVSYWFIPIPIGFMICFISTVGIKGLSSKKNNIHFYLFFWLDIHPYRYQTLGFDWDLYFYVLVWLAFRVMQTCHVFCGCDRSPTNSIKLVRVCGKCRKLILNEISSDRGVRPRNLPIFSGKRFAFE